MERIKEVQVILRPYVEASKRVDGKNVKDIKFYSRDTNSSYIRFIFEKNDGSPLLLDDTHKVTVRLRFLSDDSVHKSHPTIEEDGTALYYFDTNLITAFDHVEIFVYLEKGDMKADVYSFTIKVDLSEADKESGGERLPNIRKEDSESGLDIITAINENETISINMTKISGLQATLDEKENAGVAESRANTALQNAKEYADGVIVDAMNRLIGGAGEAYNTLGELQAFIETHGGQIDELINATHKHVVNIGDGVATEHTITHNLNTSGVIVQIRETIAPYTQVIADVEIVDENSILIRTSRPVLAEEKLNVTVISQQGVVIDG